MSTKVFVPDVLEALELATDETSSYIHEATGRVVTLSHEDLRLAEDLEGDTSTLPDWQKNTVAEALDVLASEQWLQLPSKRDLHEWEFMDDFARTVVDPVKRGELTDAIRRRGAFRRFKGTVRRLDLEDAWYAYRASALDRIAREWLAAHGFEGGAHRPVAAPRGASNEQRFRAQRATRNQHET
jgi:hypothetical protein